MGKNSLKGCVMDFTITGDPSGIQRDRVDEIAILLYEMGLKLEACHLPYEGVESFVVSTQSRKEFVIRARYDEHDGGWLEIERITAMSEKKLVSLEEHNKQAMKQAVEEQELAKAYPSGIACPKCGMELVENRTYVMTSFPPQTPVKCKACGFQGTRF